MGDDKPPFNVIDGGFAKSRPGDAGKIASPDAPPLANLTGSERRVWDYICENLRTAGIEHITAGLAIKVIARTYVDWIDATKLCEDEGRYGKGPNGGSYELPHSYTEKQLKRDLLKWLPEACLTIPSLVAVRAKLGGESLQDDLFGALVDHATAHRSA